MNPHSPTPATPGAALEQPAKSQVTPSDINGTLPPAWAVKAAEDICQISHRELYRPCFNTSTALHQIKAFKTIDTIRAHYAAIIARHAPPPVPVSPPNPNLVLVDPKLGCPPVSPPCKELVKLLSHMRSDHADQGHTGYVETLDRTITFISGAGAVARKE